MSDLETDSIQLRLSSGKIISHGITAGQVTLKALEPIQQASITISDDRCEELNQLLLAGDTVQVLLNGHPVITGQLLVINQNDSEFQLEIASAISALHISNIEPSVRFERGMTVKQAFQAVLDQPAFKGKYKIDASPAADQKLISGQPVSNAHALWALTDAATTTSNEPGADVDPSAKTINELKPQDAESCGQYLERICKRRGLAFWGSGDGKSIIIAGPNYKDGNLKVTRLLDLRQGANNITSGSKQVSAHRQPAIVIVRAACKVSGADTLVKPKVIAINELFGIDENGSYLPEIQELIKKYPQALVLPIRSKLSSYRRHFAGKPTCAAVHAKDTGSQTLEEMKKLCRKTLSDIQKSVFKATYTVPGFSQNNQLWSTNLMVKVQDQKFNLNDKLYVDSVTFIKDRNGGGTSTQLELILPYTNAIDDEA